MLTFNVFNNNSFFCTTLTPPSPIPASYNFTNTSCSFPSGPFALSSSIPLHVNHELTTLQTRLRAVDPFGNELLCVDVANTPLTPGPLGSVYGHAKYIFWASVALCIAYWVVVGMARITSAWGRRAEWSASGFFARVETVGYVLASAISGESFAKSPALLRFGQYTVRKSVDTRLTSK